MAAREASHGSRLQPSFTARAAHYPRPGSRAAGGPEGQENRCIAFSGLCLVPGPGAMWASSLGFPVPGVGAVLSPFPQVNAFLGCFCQVAFASTSLPLPNTHRSGPQGCAWLLAGNLPEMLTFVKNGVEQSRRWKRARGSKNSRRPPWSCLNSIGLRTPVPGKAGSCLRWVSGGTILGTGLRVSGRGSWVFQDPQVTAGSCRFWTFRGPELGF